jgi:ubiquinone/menaquinone biosynthesis C-methylase UbiE
MASQSQSDELHEESAEWQRAYRDPKLVARRMRKHRPKLERLGVLAWPRETRILDLCCGTGEVLRILHAEGFKYLSGVDVTADPELQKESWLELKAGDGRALPYADKSFDAVLCMHALHHLGGVDGIHSALGEAMRILQTGGRLALIDHYDSAQLRLAFWSCRQPWFAWPTSGLRSFRKQLNEEWPYLTEYLSSWPQVRKTIEDIGCEAELDKKGLFFFYWVGRKNLEGKNEAGTII